LYEEHKLKMIRAAKNKKKRDLHKQLSRNQRKKKNQRKRKKQRRNRASKAAAGK
jgi:hypothetical protein